MADSDNSRTLPVVTRRRLLSTSAAWLAAHVADVHASLHPEIRWHDGGDPTLMLWREWRAAHEQVVKFCRKQQRLETALIAAVGFPHVDTAVPDQDCVVAAFTMEEIERRFGDAPESAEAKMQAKAVLAERQAVWDALDERMGYSRAKQAELEAFAMRADRLAVLFAQPANSVTGAAAKLHAVLAMAEDDGPPEEFPWPQIRAVMTDLIRLGSGRSDN
jgi:glycine/D-amino acid oxidase-like deaminating enzyme